MINKILVSITLLLLFSAPALADCSYNGKTYPEGTVIGPYVCQDGKWVAK